jgi:hypothetical protein
LAGDSERTGVSNACQLQAIIELAKASKSLEEAARIMSVSLSAFAKFKCGVSFKATKEK